MKKKFNLTKRIIIFMICLSVIMNIMPITAHAFPGDGGQPGLTTNNPGQYEINNQTVLVYVTSSGGDVARTSGENDDKEQQYTATAHDNWKFSHWITYYEGTVVKDDNPQFGYGLGDDYYFSKPGDSETKYIKTNATIQINNEWDATGTYYLYAIFKPKVAVNSDLHYSVSITDKEAGFDYEHGSIEKYVPYNETVKISVLLDNHRVPLQVTINNVNFTNYEFLYGYQLEFDFLVTEPTNINVTSRLINQNVHFDFNGGKGSMQTQTFSYGQPQDLTANSFTRENYTFEGWNTKADGSGTSYTDKQTVAFTPENDGDSITLYAQWKTASTYINEPTANELTYNGNDQNLVKEGNTNDGTVMYSLEESRGYSKNIPTAKNAGTYVVYYYVKGDREHYDTEIKSIDVTIAQADPKIGTVSAGIVSNTTDISAIVLERTNNTVDGKLTVEAGQTLELGENEVTYIFTPNDTVNYKVIRDKVKVTVEDTIAPTGKVTITDAKTIWDKILETITFDLYFNTDQKVIVQATDSFSGIEKVEYYETTDILNLDEIKILSDDMWKTIEEDSVVVTAEDAKQFIYYIRITDKSGNITYIATNGAEFDTTNPLISGVNNGETYYTSQKITVTDKNIDTVMLNGATVTETIILEGNKEDIYTIIATDKVGNSSTVTVKMAKLADIIDINCDNVILEDKAELEDVKTDLEKSLEENADIYSEDEKKAIEEKIKNIDEALEVIINVEDVETIINNLPDKIKKDDTEDVETAKKTYDNLSDYEKTLINLDAEKKLEAAIKAVEELNKPISNPQTGDSIMECSAILIVAVIGLFVTIKLKK